MFYEEKIDFFKNKQVRKVLTFRHSFKTNPTNSGQLRLTNSSGRPKAKLCGVRRIRSEQEKVILLTVLKTTTQYRRQIALSRAKFAPFRKPVSAVLKRFVLFWH